MQPTISSDGILSVISRCTRCTRCIRAGRKAYKTRARKLTILNDSFPPLCRGRFSFPLYLCASVSFFFFSFSLLYHPFTSLVHFTSMTGECEKDISSCEFELRILRLRSPPSKYNAAPLRARASHRRCMPGGQSRAHARAHASARVRPHRR